MFHRKNKKAFEELDTMEAVQKVEKSFVVVAERKVSLNAFNWKLGQRKSARANVGVDFMKISVLWLKWRFRFSLWRD